MTQWRGVVHSYDGWGAHSQFCECRPVYSGVQIIKLNIKKIKTSGTLRIISK